MNNQKGTLRSVIPVFLLVGLLGIWISGCGGQTPEQKINLVKKGVLDFDTSLILGDALDNYKYFQSTNWSFLETGQGREIVEFEGVLINLGDNARLIYLHQFPLSQEDETFQTGSSELVLVKNSRRKSNFKQANLIEKIYKNQEIGILSLKSMMMQNSLNPLMVLQNPANALDGFQNRAPAFEMLWNIMDAIYDAIINLKPALQDPDPEVRSNAAGTYGFMTELLPDVMIPVSQGLEDSSIDQNTRLRVGLEMQGIEEKLQLLEDSVSVLIQMLQDQELNVRVNAATALGQSKEATAVPALTQALHLQDQDETVRASVAEALKKIGSPEALRALKETIPALIQALQDRDPEVRSNAAYTLGGKGEGAVDAVPALIQLLKDQNGDVRSNSAGALGQIGTPEAIKAAKGAIPALVQALQNKDIRVTAAGALGQIGTPEAIKAAEGAVPDLIQALQDQDDSARRTAAVALGKVGESAKDAVPALIQALQDEDSGVRGNAAWALGEIGEGIPDAIKAAVDAVPALIQALQDQNGWVRGNSASALVSIGTPDAIKAANRAVPALIHALQDKETMVRASAAEALGQIGSVGAVPALIQTLKDQEEDVRYYTAEALKKIGTSEALKAVKEYGSQQSPTY